MRIGAVLNGKFSLVGLMKISNMENIKASSKLKVDITRQLGYNMTNSTNPSVIRETSTLELQTVPETEYRIKIRTLSRDEREPLLTINGIYEHEDGEYYTHTSDRKPNVILSDALKSKYSSSTSSLREGDRKKQELEAQISSLTGCFELCKPYAPLIITVEAGIYPKYIDTIFYYDGNADTFTLTDITINSTLFFHYHDYIDKNGFARFILSLPDTGIEDLHIGKEDQWYPVNNFYYWKNASEGYCVVVGYSDIHIFPIIDDETVYSPYKITYVRATDEEIRAKYDKEKPTRFQQVRPSFFSGGSAYTEFETVRIPFDEYLNDFRKNENGIIESEKQAIIGRLNMEIGFTKFSGQMKR